MAPLRLVTGGLGFIGASLVRALVEQGEHVRILDNASRGSTEKLGDAAKKVEIIEGDIRDPAVVLRAMKGVTSVVHLAYVNGTEYFYKYPAFVLDVGVKGMVNVLDAAIANGVKEFILASSSEAYQSPAVAPTPEDVALVVPDPHNPRYSYGGGKIISELMAINYAREHFDRMMIFRPHNVYGPAMGYEHVIPQFIGRLSEHRSSSGTVDFPIQGSGTQTRSFIHIDDFTRGLMAILEKGIHMQTYHIGTMDEVTIRELATKVAVAMGIDIRVQPGKEMEGSTPRRCPDITKLKGLGFTPSVTLEKGLQSTVKWYLDHPIQKKINFYTSPLPSNSLVPTYGPITACQTCGHTPLEPVLFLGYLPPVNLLTPLSKPHDKEEHFPAEVLRCSVCHLVQLGYAVDPNILFPPEYPYTSGTTRILRENFAELFQESSKLLGLNEKDFVIDIGSNDGTLLKNFLDGGCTVLGVEPSLTAKLAENNGVETMMTFFNKDSTDRILKEKGKAKVVTAANVFAHIHDVNDIVNNIVKLLDDDGVFISESHYFLDLLKTVQYDTVYHEHLRYYTLTSLSFLLQKHGLHVFHARRIPTHGGSIRVYASKKPRAMSPSVQALLQEEKDAGLLGDGWVKPFQDAVLASKLELYEILSSLKKKGARIVAIGAPSRASTLLNYLGLDHGTVECVYEIKGSQKIDKYMPGRAIPVLEESGLYTTQPTHALLFSWHIASELMPALKKRGYKGDFIIPLPRPKVVANTDVTA